MYIDISFFLISIYNDSSQVPALKTGSLGSCRVLLALGCDFKQMAG